MSGKIIRLYENAPPERPPWVEGYGRLITAENHRPRWPVTLDSDDLLWLRSHRRAAAAKTDKPACWPQNTEAEFIVMLSDCELRNIEHERERRKSRPERRAAAAIRKARKAALGGVDLRTVPKDDRG